MTSWSPGFSFGYKWLEPSWHNHVPKAWDEQSEENKFETVPCATISAAIADRR